MSMKMKRIMIYRKAKNTCSVSLKVSSSQELLISYLLLMRIVSTDDARQTKYKRGLRPFSDSIKKCPQRKFHRNSAHLRKRLEIVPPKKKTN